MALCQTEPQQTQEQTKETQTTAPTKGKKMKPAQEQEATKPQVKPETGTNVRGQTNVKGRAPEVNKKQSGMRSSTSTGTSQTNVNTGQTNVGRASETTIKNNQEFTARHTDVYNLGRDPTDRFV